MTPDVQALVTDLGKKIDALIERRTAAAVLPIATALQGLGGIQSKLLKAAPTLLRKISRPARVAKPRGDKNKNGRLFTEDFKRGIAARALKLPAKSRIAFAGSKGIDKSSLYAWMKEYGGFARAKAGEPKAKEGKRRRHTPEFKADVIEKASKLAPGDRETYLAGLGLNKSLYYKWGRSVRKPAA